MLSGAGKMWNLTYVVRAGRYFLWRRLTGIHDAQDQKPQNHGVSLGREFQVDLLFRKCAINKKLLQVGESLSAPCYSAMKSGLTAVLIGCQFQGDWRVLRGERGVLAIQFTNRIDSRIKTKR